jgi:predicted alpha/beta-fold hydrolase
LPLIADIQVPTLILTARDDPFIAPEPFEGLNVPAHIHIQVTEHGGHLGFLGWDGGGGVRWAERRVVDWVMGGPSGSLLNGARQAPSLGHFQEPPG